MSEANKIAVVAFYKQALKEGDVENAFKLYAEHSGEFRLRRCFPYESFLRVLGLYRRPAG